MRNVYNIRENGCVNCRVAAIYFIGEELNLVVAMIGVGAISGIYLKKYHERI